VTEINFDVLTPEQWRARPGAFSPRSAFPGTGVLGVGGGTGPCAIVRSVPRVQDGVVLPVPVPQSALMAQLGQANNYNHMTSVYAVGEGASGPPPYREPV
jgi:hypothetical protein